MVLRAAEDFADKVQEYFPDATVYLFGSQVSGRATKYSDIDIAVVVDEVPGFSEDSKSSYYASVYLDVLTQDLDDPIDAHLIERRHEKSGFANEVFATGRLLRSPLPHDLYLPKVNPVDEGKKIVDAIFKEE